MFHGVYLEQAAAGTPRAAAESLGYDPATHPVGTFIDYDKTLNAGGAAGPLPVRLVSGVSVNPGFRRRGILRHMMTAAMGRAVEDGLPLMALTASEGGIYGRFGYGGATREARITVSTGPEFKLRKLSTGRVLAADPAKLEEVIGEVFSAFHVSSMGSVGRQRWYWETGTARWNQDDVSEQDRSLRAAIYTDDHGAITGYVTYHAVREGVTEPYAKICDLVAADATAYLELWRYLAGLDLLRKIQWDTAPVSDPLVSALTDPRCYAVRGIKDMLWVRILDVVESLQARQWAGDGDFTLDITDSAGISEGAYALSVRNGQAQVQRLGEPGAAGSAVSAPAAFEPGASVPETFGSGSDERSGGRFSLDIDTLGALYLGDTSVLTLRDAGRISTNSEGSWAQFSAAVDLPRLPYCATHF